MKYYISDLHLFHENAIEFDHRPFTFMMMCLTTAISSCFMKSMIIKKCTIWLAKSITVWY